MLKEGEGYDSPRVKAEVGPVAMMMLHNAMEQQNYGSLIGELESSDTAQPGIGSNRAASTRTVYESDACRHRSGQPW